jgi:hypothetical protein
VSPVGSPAIVPSIVGAGPTAAFTGDDVIQYNNTLSKRSFGERGISTAPPTVARIEFLTERELRTRFRITTGWPGNTLFCYVQYSGTFLYSRGPWQRSVITTHTALEIFHAHTGNLIVSGVGP